MKKHIWLALLLTCIVMFATALSSCGSTKPTLSTSINPDGGGSVSPSSGTYDKGVAVDITARPASGYRFDHWEGSASGESSNVHVVMDGNKKLIAYFTKTYTLSISTTPVSGGNISPSSGTYDEGKEVTLIVSPAQCYRFNGWGGDVSGSSDHLSITMDSNKQIIASFGKLTHSFQTQVDPSGGGVVDPSGGTFEACTQKTITATPASGYRFDHWGSSALGTANPVNVLMDSDKTITASFTKVYTLTMSCSPNAGGIISPNSGVYDAGTIVKNLTATANFPYAFKNWSGTDSDSLNPTTVTMDTDKTITAYFTELTPGVPQSQSGMIYNYGTPMPVIPLSAGQWVEVGIYVIPNSAVSILDSDFGVLQDLGLTSTKSYTFQAKKSGDYTVKIRPNSLTGTEYRLKYTVYS